MIRGLIAAALSALLLGAGCAATSGSIPLAHSDVPFPRDTVSSFVEAEGQDFTVDGRPFRFVGVNIYDAAATDRYSCDSAKRMSDVELDDTLAKLHDVYGATVLRFWAYQTYTAGGQDFSGMDRVIAAAKRVGMRVIPVLEDGPGHCTTLQEVVPKAEYRDDTWFTEGYRTQYGNASLSYRDYAKTVAEHYRDEPVILGWSLFNEAETGKRNDQGRSVLVDFARDMAQVVRSADSRHLITLGTQSNGAPGASGPDFTAVYGLPEIDFAEVHDWGYWGSDSDPMPGGNDGAPPAADSSACQRTDAPIACSFARLPELNKPLFVGEAGVVAADPDARVKRAAQLGRKMKAAYSAGAVGYLLWRVTKESDNNHDITLISNDPVLNEMADIATDLR